MGQLSKLIIKNIMQVFKNSKNYNLEEFVINTKKGVSMFGESPCVFANSIIQNTMLLDGIAA